MSKKYSNFHLGQGQSKNIQNRFFDTENVDIHKEVFSVTNQKSLERKYVAPPCYTTVNPSGEVYLFSATDGGIFKRSQEGTYSNVRNNPNGAHKGAIYYEGQTNQIYYTTNHRLGRFDGTTWNDNFQVLNSGVNHSMFEFDLLLYICNGKDLAALDETDTFTPSALDVQQQHELVSLIDRGDDLLLLGNGGKYRKSAIYLWLYSTGQSWASRDTIPEPMFSFIDADNIRFGVAHSGQIYLYENMVMQPFVKIAPFSSPTSQLTCNFRGKSLIANGRRIYSIHRSSRDMPVAIACEFTAGGHITSILPVGENLIVSHEHGVDEISEDYAEAKLTTPLSTRPTNKISVAYQEMPPGCSISLETKIDNGPWKQQPMLNAEHLQMFYTKNTLSVKRNIQARVTLIPNGNTAPVIDDIIFA